MRARPLAIAVTLAVGLAALATPGPAHAQVPDEKGELADAWMRDILERQKDSDDLLRYLGAPTAALMGGFFLSMPAWAELPPDWEGTADDRHIIYSCTKSWGSTLIGIAVTQGLLDVQDPVTKWVPEPVAGVSEGALVEHLLTQSAHTNPPGALLPVQQRLPAQHVAGGARGRIRHAVARLLPALPRATAESIDDVAALPGRRLSRHALPRRLHSIRQSAARSAERRVTAVERTRPGQARVAVGQQRRLERTNADRPQTAT